MSARLARWQRARDEWVSSLHPEPRRSWWNGHGPRGRRYWRRRRAYSLGIIASDSVNHGRPCTPNPYRKRAYRMEFLRGVCAEILMRAPPYVVVIDAVEYRLS